jgi:hypothetical protein
MARDGTGVMMIGSTPVSLVVELAKNQRRELTDGLYSLGAIP